MSCYLVTYENGQHSKMFATCEEAMDFADHLEAHGDLTVDVVSGLTN